MGKRHADTVPHTESWSFAGLTAVAVALQDARAGRTFARAEAVRYNSIIICTYIHYYSIVFNVILSAIGTPLCAIVYYLLGTRLGHGVRVFYRYRN